MLQSWGRSSTRHCPSLYSGCSAPTRSPSVKRQPGSMEKRCRWASAGVAVATKTIRATRSAREPMKPMFNRCDSEAGLGILLEKGQIAGVLTDRVEVRAKTDFVNTD